MPTLPQNIYLKIGLFKFDGWSSVNINKSMNNIANTFALGTYDFSSGLESKWHISMGDLAMLYINEQLVVTGYIDDIIVSYSGGETSMSVTGRSRTCDLIDCSWSEAINEWKYQPISNIITNLCLPFSIPVTIDPSAINNASMVLETFKMNEGDYIYKAIADLCMDNGILPISTGDGTLTLTKSTVTNFAFNGLQSGINISSGTLVQNDSDRYSVYKVKGYGNGSDFKQPIEYTQPTAFTLDTIIKRYRTTTIFAERATDIGKCITKANWEARISAGNSRLIQYEVDSWTQTSGLIWDFNMLVNVTDTVLGVYGMLLISEISYLYSEDDGILTILTLVDKDTYSGTVNQILIKTRFDGV